MFHSKHKNIVVKRERKRGILLTIFLLIGIISAPYDVIDEIRQGLGFSHSLRPSIMLPSWAHFVFVLIAIINFISSIAIWRWKKWGVYIAISTYCFSFLFALIVESKMLLVILIYYLISLPVYAFIIYRSWKYLE